MKLSLVLGAAMAAINLTAMAGPGPNGGNLPPTYAEQVKTQAEAEVAAMPGEKVALVCTTCKTVNEKDGADKKGILAWFAPDDKHDCSGCGGKVTLKRLGGDKGTNLAEYTHTCSKCGDGSAFTCATHKTKS